MPGWFMTKDSESFLEMCKVFGTSTDVIGMDFRGHGKSSGFYTFTSRELLDVRAVVHYARNRRKARSGCARWAMWRSRRRRSWQC